MKQEFMIMIAKSVGLAVASAIVLLIVARTLKKIILKRAGEHSAAIINKLLLYSGSIIIVLLLLGQLGFTITALLGAAGIVGAAIGLASKNHIANIISGLCLLIESSLKIGDTITVGTTSGIITSIGFLATHLKTSDGQIIRIPNELLIKSAVQIVRKR